VYTGSTAFGHRRSAPMKRAVWLSIVCCALLAAAYLKVPMFFARQDFPPTGGAVAVGDVNGDVFQI
jgi:hypothetical protein